MTLPNRSTPWLWRAETAAVGSTGGGRVAEGGAVVTGFRAQRVEPGAGYGRDGVLRYDQLLVTTGRTPKTAHLDLEAAGVAADQRGQVQVNDQLRTTNPRIYAAGDVTGLSAFTHLAGVQAAAAVTHALLGVRRRIDYGAVPWVTFTDPEVARVGLTEAQARE